MNQFSEGENQVFLDQENKLSKDVLNKLCEFLHINDAGKLKQVCKWFNQCIEIVSVHMYTCVVDKKNLPLKADHNCLKLTVRLLKHKFNFSMFEKEFYHGSYKIMAVVIWGQLKAKRIEFNMELTGGEDFFDEDTSKTPKDFISTNILIHEPVDLTCKMIDGKIEARKLVWILNDQHDKLHLRHVNYMQKELRYIQKEVWSFPYSHTTTLELELNDLELDEPNVDENVPQRKLVLRCANGEILYKTTECLVNLMKVFGMPIQFDRTQMF